MRWHSVKYSGTAGTRVFPKNAAGYKFKDHQKICLPRFYIIIDKCRKNIQGADNQACLQYFSISFLHSVGHIRVGNYRRP